MSKGLLIAAGLGLLFIAGTAAASVAPGGSSFVPPPPRGRTATGYRNGQPVQIELVDIDDAGHALAADAAGAFFAMREAAARDGVTLLVESAFRTMEEQQYLWACYQTKSCNSGNLAAQPGFSNHQMGTAIDAVTAHGTNAAWVWLQAHAAEFGFYFTVPTEPWHLDYLGG